MTVAKKLSLGVLGITLVLLASAFWVLGTESGLRFVLAKAEPYFPAELGLSAPTGTFLRGVCVDAIDWRSESLELDIRKACVDVELVSLMAGHLAIRSLDVKETSIELKDATESAPSGELPAFESPIEISVATSSLSNLSFRRSQSHRSVDAAQFSGSLSGSRLDISELAVRSNWLIADLTGNIELTGLYPGSLNLSWQWSESPTLSLAGTLEIDGDSRRYQLDHTLSAPATPEHDRNRLFCRERTHSGSREQLGFHRVADRRVAFCGRRPGPSNCGVVRAVWR